MGYLICLGLGFLIGRYADLIRDAVRDLFPK
jgi:hypothetical protein